MLWNELIALNIQHLPWLMAGYFNTVRCTFEKNGGKSFSFQQLRSFNDVITSCSFSDLKSVGNQWSWNNKNLDGGRIVGRLDRALCNAKWLDVLPFSSCCLLYTSPSPRDS